MNTHGFLVVAIATAIGAVIVMAGEPPRLRSRSGDARLHLAIKDTKVSLEADAERIARGQYFTKMRGGILATDGRPEMSLVKLGYDVRGFAVRGDVVWQAKFEDSAGPKLRGIIWIHPKTEKAHFVTGAWEPIEEKEEAEERTK